MKIAFLCGSLESWRDGVGDYSRRLAGDLQAAGHQVLLIALADPFIEEPVALQHETNGVAVLRLPKKLWKARQLSLVQSTLQHFGADWVSLQLVIYAYDDRGLLRDLGAQLQGLCGSARRHVMFHELWIGAADRCSVKERWVGWLQKRLLLRALRQWSPQLMHTSNPVYRQLLQREGLQALPLRVPGAMAIDPISHIEARSLLTVRLGLAADQAPRVLIAGVFGAIHPEWADTANLRRLQQACVVQDRQLVLVHMGRVGAAGKFLWSRLGEQLAGDVQTLALGELPPDELSRVLRGLDLGLATTPWALVGKSSTISALLEHGVPVLVTRDDYRLRDQPTPEPDGHPLLLPFTGALPAVTLDATSPLRRPHAGEPISAVLLAGLAAGHQRR